MLLESVLNHQCATLFAVYLQTLADRAGEFESNFQTLS